MLASASLPCFSVCEGRHFIQNLMTPLEINLEHSETNKGLKDYSAAEITGKDIDSLS